MMIFDSLTLAGLIGALVLMAVVLVLCVMHGPGAGH